MWWWLAGFSRYMLRRNISHRKRVERETEAKGKLNLTLSCPVWALANKLQLFGAYDSELSVSSAWRGFTAVMFSVSSPGKTTDPEVQSKTRCLISGTNVCLSSEDFLELEILEMQLISTDVHSRETWWLWAPRNVLAEWCIVLKTFSVAIIILSLLGGIPRDSASCCNLKHHTSTNHGHVVHQYGTWLFKKSEKATKKVQMVHLSTHQCHNWAVRQDE